MHYFDFPGAAAAVFLIPPGGLSTSRGRPSSRKTAPSGDKADRNGRAPNLTLVTLVRLPVGSLTAPDATVPFLSGRAYLDPWAVT
jgi:hypothetical protein